MYLGTFLLGPPFCSPTSLRPSLVSITWKRRWEEMGGDQLTAQKGRGAPGACALFSWHCRGQLHTGRGFLAHARSWSIAAPAPCGEGASWRMRILFTALRSQLCGCASLAPSRKLEGWAGEIVRGVSLAFFPAPSSAGAYSPQVFILWHVNCINRQQPIYIEIAPILWQHLSGIWGVGNELCKSLE